MARFWYIVGGIATYTLAKLSGGIDKVVIKEIGLGPFLVILFSIGLCTLVWRKRQSILRAYKSPAKRMLFVGVLALFFGYWTLIGFNDLSNFQSSLYEYGFGHYYDGETQFIIVGFFIACLFFSLRTFRIYGTHKAEIATATRRFFRMDDTTHTTCPFCAERIKAAAIVCKHCGREISPHRPLTV